MNRSQKRSAPILETPEERRDKFPDPYFRKAKPNQVIAIVKGREPARTRIAIGNKKENRRHLQFAQRWGRMFVRMCPYPPFSARACLNRHHWLAERMREESFDFRQCNNAFPLRITGYAGRSSSSVRANDSSRGITSLYPSSVRMRVVS